MSYATEDGVRISATLRLPPNRVRRPAPAVVLVHQLDGDRHDLNALLPALGRAGYATLVYDIRGMGRSNGMVDGTVFRPGVDRDAYVEAMPRDVTAALRFLRGRRDIDGERVAVIGSSVEPTSRSPQAGREVVPTPRSRSPRSPARHPSSPGTGAGAPGASC